MGSDRSSRLRELFNLALDRPVSERSSFLDGACGDDAALRAEALSLLAAFDEAHSFLEAPGGAAVAAAVADDSATVLIGKSVGHYRLERLIAAGGMGVVYEALQDQPRRTAAVKVIRAGIASRPALRRFAHEAEILGRLRHPGIAQVYEAGTHDVGGGRVPYFAMEYIPQPRTIVEFANAERLTARDRLELFARVCDAVQHAHQHGVIHRDLKPGNILVDPAGQPKVVDFGVARATDADLQTTTLQTDMGQLIGTIPYMSPEQVKGDPHELDTRSDVYSLGVVCYELLAGELPYAVKGQPLPEAVRVIREEDPTALGSVDRIFRGDVETVVAKALEKDRSRRYQSASDFAADVRRYLNDEPIIAHPPSTLYQLGKFARRNRALVGGVAAVFVVLVVGIVATTAQAAAANTAREAESLQKTRAQQQARVAQSISDFFGDVVSAASPRKLGHDARVVDALADAAAGVEDAFADDPSVKAAVHGVIGKTYADLSLPDAARPHLQAAIDLLSEAKDPQHPDTLHARRDWGVMLTTKGQQTEADSYYRDLLETCTRVLGEEDYLTLEVTISLSSLLQSAGDFEECEALALYGLETAREVYGDDDPLTLGAEYNLGCLRFLQQRFDEAEDHLNIALEGRRRVLGEDHPRTWQVSEQLGQILFQTGRYEEFEALYRAALEQHLAKAGEEHGRTAYIFVNLGRACRRLNRLDEAEEYLRKGVAINERLLGNDSEITLTSKNALALLFQSQRKYAEAAEMFANMIEQAETRMRPDDYRIAAFYMNRGECLMALRRYDEAIEQTRIAVQMLNDRFGSEHNYTIMGLGNIIQFYYYLDRPDQAQPYIEMLPPKMRPPPDWEGPKVNPISKVADFETDDDRADPQPP